jgi:hypothetical protein
MPHQFKADRRDKNPKQKHRVINCAEYDDSQRGYWDFPDLMKRVIAAQKKLDADFIMIEKASSGLALLEELFEHYPREISRKLLKIISPRHSKEDRVAKAMVLVEDKKVFFPTQAH